MSEERELTPEELAASYPKMLYRLKPNPAYTTAEDPEHEKKLISQGWKKRDSLTARQIESCANQDRFQPVDHGDKTGNQGSAEAFKLHSIAQAEFKEEVNERFELLEAKINELQEAMASEQSVQTEPVATEPEGGAEQGEGDEPKNDGDEPPSGETDQGASGQGETPAEYRYGEIAPIIGRFLEQDPEKQNPDLWTKEGSPNANALGEELGSDVGADERDNVWERFQRAQSRLPK